MTTTVLPDPIFEGITAVHELPGLSRAQVFLVTRDRRYWWIRKIARHSDHNQRLQQQVQRQMSFAAWLSGAIKTPPIISQGVAGGRFFVDMEAIRGVDGATYLRCADYRHVRDFTGKIQTFLAAIALRPSLNPPQHATLFDAIYSKLCSVQATTKLFEGPILAKLFLTAEGLRKVENPQPTLCHGDLTLENLIVDAQGTVWLLDFLDAPYEHVFQDVAKLHQDLMAGWYLRNHKAIAPCVLSFVSQAILRFINDQFPLYRMIHPLMLAITLARILPYASNPSEQEFILTRIRHIAGKMTGHG